jgi:imidazolonepropionase-like amidohydrolase
LGKLEILGTLEAGKAADLVLVQGDVVADISRLCNPDNIRLVVQAGRIVHRTGEAFDLRWNRKP